MLFSFQGTFLEDPVITAQWSYLFPSRTQKSSTAAAKIALWWIELVAGWFGRTYLFFLFFCLFNILSFWLLYFWSVWFRDMQLLCKRYIVRTLEKRYLWLGLLPFHRYFSIDQLFYVHDQEAYPTMASVFPILLYADPACSLSSLSVHRSDSHMSSGYLLLLFPRYCTYRHWQMLLTLYLKLTSFSL